jgi:hypothetical protein
LTNAKLSVLNKAQLDLIYLGRVITPDTFYFPTPPFHYKIAPAIIDPLIKQLLLIAPRGTAKSSLTVKSVMHHYLFIAQQYEMDAVIVIQSKTRKESVKRLWSIKNTLEYNKIYKDLFGYHGEKSAEIWREDYIKFRYNGRWVTIVAIGTGQQVRGILEDDTRVTYLLLDDPEDEECTATPDQMDKNYEKFLAGIGTLDKRLGYVRVIGTPITQGCMVDRISSNPQGWTVFHFNARKDADGNPGLLWEQMLSEQDLDNLKKDRESKGMIRSYYADYECTVKGEEEGMFKGYKWWDGDLVFDEGLPYLVITKLGSKKDELITLSPPKIVAVNNFVGIDPASSTKKTADQSVTFPISYSNDGDIYTHPYYNRRVPPTAHAEQIVESIKQFKFRYGSVETTAYQEMLRDYLKVRMREEELSLPGLEFKWQERTDKNKRLESLEPFFTTNHVYYKVGVSDELEEQTEFYPNNKKSPNLLDGFYFATRKMVKPEHKSENYKLAKEPLDDDEIIRRYRELHNRVNKKTLKVGNYLAA